MYLFGNQLFINIILNIVMLFQLRRISVFNTPTISAIEGGYICYFNSKNRPFCPEKRKKSACFCVHATIVQNFGTKIQKFA